MWKSININTQNIEAQTSKAVLIKMPNSSIYHGYSFWHPSKLVRSGKHSYSVSVSYTDEFVFRLKKYGQGKWNKSKVIDGKEIDAEEFETAFEVMDDNITAPQPKNPYETHVPKELTPAEPTVPEELKDE